MASRVAAPRPTLLRVAAAFLRRDLAIQASYRFTFVTRTVSAILVVASFGFMARFMDQSGARLPLDRYGQAGYLGFWLVGLVTGELFYASAMMLARKVRDAQLEGTLEAMLATPVPAAHVVLCAPLGDVALSLLRVAVLLAAGPLLFGVRFGPVNWLTLAITMPLALLAFAALGLLGGALAMALRRTDPVTALVGLMAMLIGGMLYPVDVLPRALQAVAYAIPLAPAVEALRRALFVAASPAELAPELLALGGFVVTVGGLGGALFAWALRRAREDGSLGQY